MATLTRSYTFTAHTLGRAAHVEGEFDNFLANINTRLCADGTLHFTGTDPLTLEYDAPYLEFIDTQTSGETWRIQATVDSGAWLSIDYYDSGWNTLMRFPRTPTAQRCQMDMDVQVMTLIARDNTPTLTFEGTEASGEYFRLEETAGALNIAFYDTGGPTWDTLMAFNDNTDVDILVPLKVDTIKEYTGSAGVTIDDNAAVTGTLEVTGATTLTGGIATAKAVTAANLDMDKVCTLTFSRADMLAGDAQGTSNQYVYKAITGATGGGLMWYIPLISSATLNGAGSKGVEACIVYDPVTTWQVCIVLHDYIDDVANEVVVEVYEWQAQPADH